MKVEHTSIKDVLVVTPKIFGDARGFFMETFNAKVFAEETGLSLNFVQDNHSRSQKGVLRGLHYQIQNPQGKLVRVSRGAVFDVAVDMRFSSPTFGQGVGVELSEDNQKQLWVPPGFAHGFVVLSDQADFLYKTTDYYFPEHECSVRWNDVDIGIHWPCSNPQLSQKDAQAPLFKDAITYS